MHERGGVPQLDIYQKTSQSCLNNSQEPCEWVDADLDLRFYG